MATRRKVAVKNRLVDTGRYYVRDKLLAAAQVRDIHRHAVSTLAVVVSGRLREDFAHGTIDCGDWSVLFKPAGIPHTTVSGALLVTQAEFGERVALLNALLEPWLDEIVSSR